MSLRRQERRVVEVTIPKITVGTGEAAEQFLPDGVRKTLAKIARKYNGVVKKTDGDVVTVVFTRNRDASAFWNHSRSYLKDFEKKNN